MAASNFWLTNIQRLYYCFFAIIVTVYSVAFFRRLRWVLGFTKNGLRDRHLHMGKDPWAVI
jgi:hypothetical protein